MNKEQRIRRANDEDFDFNEFKQYKRVSIKYIPVREITIRITRPITKPDDFLEEIEALNGATEFDVVKIHIETDGGEVGTANELCRAIRNCDATTIGVIGISCASAGSAIALACDHWEVDELSTLMIHEFSYSPGWSKSSNISSIADFTKKLNEKWLRETYTGFLTEAEIKDCLHGEDKFFLADELKIRLEKYSNYRTKKENCEFIEEEVEIKKPSKKKKTRNEDA
jgi:ATP-dependent protease ClpP protease subunit